jgi:hypothetical protein
MKNFVENRALREIKDMSSLAEIFNKWGTDKAQNSSGPRGHAENHGYAGVYECLFRRWRHDVKSVLEIGIGTMLPGVPSSMLGWALEGYRPGGSLRAWREYFHAATIYAIDVQPDTQLENEERIVTRLCDSTDQAQVRDLMRNSFVDEFDVIIDDASHDIGDQLKTLHNFFPYLKRRGMYILEDVTQLEKNLDKAKEIIGDNPFFLLGPYCNFFAVMKRD